MGTTDSYSTQPVSVFFVKATLTDTFQSTRANCSTDAQNGGTHGPQKPTTQQLQASHHKKSSSTFASWLSLLVSTFPVKTQFIHSISVNVLHHQTITP
jgi:hypothetical protein